MGGKSDDTQTVTQVQKLPPQISSALDFLVSSSMGLAGQYGVGRGGVRTTGEQLTGQPGGVTPFFSGGNNDHRQAASRSYGGYGGSLVATGGGFMPAPRYETSRGGFYPHQRKIAGEIPEPSADPNGFNFGGLNIGGASPLVNGVFTSNPIFNFGPEPKSIVPELSEDTIAALGMLRGAYQDNPAVAELERTVNGDYSNPYTGTAVAGRNYTSAMNPNANLVNRYGGAGNRFGGMTAETSINPHAGTSNRFASTSNRFADDRNQYAGMRNTRNAMNQYAGMRNEVADTLNPMLGTNNLDALTEAISHAARKSVADRFAESGRSGSGNEGLALGETVTRELAPYVFSANESDLQRRFNAGESLVNRMNNAEESRLARLNSAGENAVDRSFGSEENRIARLTGVSESRLDRMTGSEQERIRNIIGAEENRLGRLDSAGEALVGRQFAANRDRINNLISTEESRLGRQLVTEEDRLGRIYAAGETATNRAFGSEEDRLAREFAAQESALARGFSGYEAERARQLAAIAPLLNLPVQQAQNYLNAGSIIEGYNREKALEPFQLASMVQNPLVAAIGGSPISSTTSQPLNRNLGSSALGGALAGQSLATAMGATGPLGAIAGGILGLLG